MAKPFLTPINLNRNEVQNALLQNLGTEPSAPALGQFWINTSDGFMHYKGGTATIIVGGWESLANKGVANGYAALDSTGKIPLAQLPSSLTTPLTYLGLWNASTNSPQLASGTGTRNTFYIVSTPGSTSLDSVASWLANDWVIFDGTHWDKISGNDATAASVGKYAALVGDGTSTSFTVTQATHGRGAGTTNAINVYDNTSGAQVQCDITCNSAGDVTVAFALAPSANQYRVVIVG